MIEMAFIWGFLLGVIVGVGFYHKKIINKNKKDTSNEN